MGICTSRNDSPQVRAHKDVEKQLREVLIPCDQCELKLKNCRQKRVGMLKSRHVCAHTEPELIANGSLTTWHRYCFSVQVRISEWDLSRVLTGRR